MRGPRARDLRHARRWRRHRSLSSDSVRSGSLARAALVFTLWKLALAWSPGAQAAPRSNVVVEPGGPESIRIVVETPAAAVTLADAEDGRARITIAGVESRILRPGAPELPVVVIPLLAASADRPGVEIAAGPAIRLEGPPPSPVPGFDGTLGRTIRATDDGIYRGEGPWPERVVEVEQARFRGIDVARVIVHPVRFDPRSASSWLSERIEVTLRWPPGVGAQARRFDRSRFREAFEPRPEAARPASVRGASAGPAVKISVAEEGLIRVSRETLASVGFPVDAIDPRHLALSYRGATLPCRVVGESDGHLDPGDAVEFWGRPGTGRFSRENVYRLEAGETPGPRLPTRGAAPVGASPATSFPHPERFEESNGVYTFGKPAQEGDPHFFWAWFEDNPNPPRVTVLTHSADLPGLATGPGSARVRALLAGRTDPPADPDHRLRVRVNGTAIGETTWNGIGFHTADLPFDAALLAPGTNEIRFEMLSVATPDIYYLDWFEVVYPRAVQVIGDRVTISTEGAGPVRYDVGGVTGVSDLVALDVSDPLAPVALTGAVVSGSGPYTASLAVNPSVAARVHVAGDAGRVAPSAVVLDLPSTLREPANGADLIVVVPEGWEGTLAPLAVHRESEGWRVAVVSLTDVADEFGGGNVDDLAIRDFVAYAASVWQAPAPRALLLVGAPNLDVMNDLGRADHAHLMPTHPGVTDNLGETATDTWFGAVAGADLLPDLAVARWSVTSPAEAAALVAKTIGYETGADPGADWVTRVIHVASSEAGFESALEASALALPPWVTVRREYRRQGANATTIVGAFDEGAAVASFLGHGNVTIWADNPGGTYFAAGNATSIVNPGRMPFVTAMNCLNGSVAHPAIRDSLAEVFHNHPIHGALAYWSTSALGFLPEYDALEQRLYRWLYQDRVPWLGEATVLALVETWLTEPVEIDLVKEMVLLGDPSGWIAIDSDGDLGFDADEWRRGLDPGDRDTEDDGLLDGLEGSGDADADGLADALDPDSDGDALPDGLEAGVAVPDGDTDLSAGRFVPDSDPATATDPLDADSDGGGAPDGAEDLDGNGRVDPGETDPLLGSDDPICATTAPPEIAVAPPDQLRLGREGNDLVVTWGDARGLDPCLLYRVWVADDLVFTAGPAGFHPLAVTAQPTFVHRGAATDGLPHRYRVTAFSFSAGEGP